MQFVPAESFIYPAKANVMGLWIAILVVVLCACAFLVYASYSISAGIYLKSFCKGNTAEKAVALTFDDGPDPEHTPAILSVLKEFDAPATFFCIGGKCRMEPELLKAIHNAGHRIGNHSYTHRPLFPCYSKKEMTSELLRTSDVIEEITGEKTDLFRPPFGVTNPAIASVVRRSGYRSIGWSIRSFDTRNEPEEKILKRIIRQIRPGAVILLHDRMPHTASILRKLLLYLKEQGYRVISIDKLIENA